MKKYNNQSGYTVIELMIALFVTGIIAAAGFQFYVQMHNSALTQEEISEMQQSSRACLEEISQNLRMAGFKVGSHPAYRINGESLYVFASISQPVDTILYFLDDYADYQLVIADSLDAALRPRKLMIQVNNGTPEVFSDNIRTISYNALSSGSVVINLTVQPMKADMAYVDNEGYRLYAASERVNIRNVDM